MKPAARAVKMLSVVTVPTASVATTGRSGQPIKNISLLALMDISLKPGIQSANNDVRIEITTVRTCTIPVGVCKY
jgi:hypothetical protein